MKHRLNILLFLILGLSFNSFSQKNFGISHIPVDTAAKEDNIQIKAMINSGSLDIWMARIYFKTPSETSYQNRSMKKYQQQWVGYIPARQLSSDRIQYFISVLLSDQTVLTYPDKNPYKEPITINITERSKPAPAANEKKPVTEKKEQPKPTMPSLPERETHQSQPVKSPKKTPKQPQLPKSSPVNESGEFVILSPEPNEKLDQVYFAASFSHIDSNSIQLYLDGENVTSQAEISEYVLTFQSSTLAPGNHTIKISSIDKKGEKATKSIAFVTKSSETESVRSDFSAHIFTDLRRERVAKQNESLAMGGASFRGQYGQLRYNGRFFLTSLEDKRYQPRNRFYLSVGTDWFGVTGGDNYPRYNDLILWGKRVRGMNGYLKLGFFKIQTIYGETYRGVEGTLRSSVMNPDSLFIGRYGRFDQKLFGIRTSFGSGRKFQLGLSFVKVKDDTGSIKYGLSPKDNIVFGPDLKISFDQGRVVFLASSALSLLTRDISPGSLSKTEIKKSFGDDTDIPFDPSQLDRFLIINDSTTPLDPTSWSSLAYNLSIKLNYFRNMLKFGYKSIGSEYTSLANLWIRKDIQGFYFSDRLRLFSNRVFLTLGYENYQDNFSQEYLNPSLDLKTWNFNTSIHPGGGFSINAGLRRHFRNNGITTIDTLYYRDINEAGIDTVSIDPYDIRQNQLQRDLNIQLGYDVQLFNANHTIQLSYLTADKTDRYSQSRLGGSFGGFSTDVRMISLTTRLNPSFVTTLDYASNDNFTKDYSDFSYNVFGLGAEYTLFNGRLTTFGEIRQTSADQFISEQAIDYSRSLFRMGGVYKFSARQTLSVDINIFRITNKNITNNISKTYRDSIVRLRYEKYF